MKSCHTNFPVTLALILILNYFIVNIVQRHQNKAMIASISRIHKALCKAMSNPQYLLLNHCYCIGNPDMQGVFDICVWILVIICEMFTISNRVRNGEFQKVRYDLRMSRPIEVDSVIESKHNTLPLLCGQSPK